VIFLYIGKDEELERIYGVRNLCLRGVLTALLVVAVLVLCSSSASAVSDEDEFVGPFSSWINVKTTFGAVGDGSHDDTSNIQNAFNSIAGGTGGTIYFPAGTYKITGGLIVPESSNFFKVQIVGHDRADTIIQWAGSTGGIMFEIHGFRYGKMGRLTWDGSGTADTAVWDNTQRVNGNWSTQVLYFDQVFKNAGYGLRIGDANGHQDSEYTIIRCQFLNNTVGGLSIQSWNSLDIWIWYSTFQNNPVGITNLVQAGNFTANYSNFLNSTTADIQVHNTSFFSMRGNYSSGSNQFFFHNNVGQNVSFVTMQGNTILDTTNSVAIESLAPATMTLIDNKIRTKAGGAAPAVYMHPGGSTGGNVESVGNTYTVSSPISCVGTTMGCWQLDDATGSVTGSQISLATPANLGRPVTEVAAAATAATIQNAVNSAVAFQGQRPVIHLPTGNYSIASTITIPANLDVQLIGDGNTTSLTWSGPAGGPIFQLQAPSKALIQDMYLNGNNAAEGIAVNSEDVSGSRIQARHVTFTNATTMGVLTQGLMNTNVNLYGYADGDYQVYNIQGPGVSGAMPIACFGCGIGAIGATSIPSVNLSNNGNLLVEDTWMELFPHPLLSASGAAGNVTIQGFQSSWTNPAPSAILMLNNYSGSFSWLTGWVGGAGVSAPINVTNGTASTNVLLMGFGMEATTAINNSGGSVFAKDLSAFNGSGWFPVADIGGTPSASFIRTALSPIRTILPSLNTPTGAGVSDVQISNLWIDYATTALHVKRRLPTPQITASLTANPTTVHSGGSSVLTWSSSAAHCNGINFSTRIGGSNPRNGSATVKNIQLTTTYGVHCFARGGSPTADASATVTIQ
jgi:hypothetical protein